MRGERTLWGLLKEHRQKGSEKNKSYINGSEVLGRIEERTPKFL